MSKVVSTYIKYKKKRAEIKARQKFELEQELTEYLRDFGEAVNEAQQGGKRIEDIEFEIGAKNRTLVYQAKRLAKGFGAPERPTTPDTAPEAADDPAQPRWQVLAVPNDGYEVYIDGGHKGTVWADEEGLVIPEEWAADIANQALYRAAIADIRGRIS